MRKTIFMLVLLLGGCAYSQTAALDRCSHTPGCTTSIAGSPYGPIQAQAIEPTAANLPRR